MTYRKPLLIALSSMVFLLLTACAASTPSMSDSQDSLKQICKNLKQDLADNTRSSESNPVGNNPTQEARLQKSYSKYQCPDVMGETR